MTRTPRGYPEGMTSPFRHIAVCVDDSPEAAEALATARRIAGDDTRVSVVHCVEPPSFLVSLAAGLGGGVIPDATPLLEAADAWVRTIAQDDEDAHVLQGAPAREVGRWAAEHGCDLLVMASSRSAAERSVLGSFSQRLALEAPCSTLIVHARR